MKSRAHFETYESITNQWWNHAVQVHDENTLVTYRTWKNERAATMKFMNINMKFVHEIQAEIRQRTKRNKKENEFWSKTMKVYEIHTLQFFWRQWGDITMNIDHCN